MKIILLYHLLFLFVCLPGDLNAQKTDSIPDAIEEKMNLYALKKVPTTLFVHFDKNVYTNNENVWFTAYLLKTISTNLHHTLSVALIRADDRSVLAEGKYLMDNGLAFGNLFLPDSLPTGNYEFVCYTNHLVDSNPSALFVQPITIKSANTLGFIARLSLAEKIVPGMDSTKVLLKAYTADVTLVKGADVSYFIGDINNPLLKGTIKTDRFGEAKIPVPLKQITGANNILHAAINNGKEVKAFSIKLPVYQKKVLAHFYPEGGYLVAGANCVVGWEVKNDEGEPLSVTAVLYKNNAAVKTIRTDAYGLGKFSLVPEQDGHYTLKIEATGYNNDSSFILPPVLATGPVLRVENALTKDTLFVQVNNIKAGSAWKLLVHNYNAVFILAAVVLKRTSTLLKIPLQDVPKGINTFTLLDDLNRPFAERLFFAHFDKKAFINITTDSSIYGTRQKVTVKFTIKDFKLDPVHALVSIACAQDNRFETKKNTDIESYVYLKNELVPLLFKRRMLSTEAENTEYLEQLLLVKGWSRYAWQELEKITVGDTLLHQSSLSLNGHVKLKEKPLKKPVAVTISELLSSKVSLSEIIKTDSTGNFELETDKIVTSAGNQVKLFVNDKIMQLYTVKINDPYRIMNRKLAGTLSFVNSDIRSFDQSSQEMVIKNEGGAKRLTDVTVSTKTDNRIYAGANICGDYVCMYNVLNCANHPSDQSMAPVVGRSYITRYGSGGPGQTMVYTGCEALNRELKKEYQVVMDGINRKKEFYVPDYSNFNPPDPEYYSTIYWSHSVLTNDAGEATVAFYTSDVPGKFRLVIQGILHNEVVYGEHFFTVRKPE